MMVTDLRMGAIDEGLLSDLTEEVGTEVLEEIVSAVQTVAPLIELFSRRNPRWIINQKQGDLSCRFGPCVRDTYQNRGLGSALIPSTLDVARRFGMHHVVLWGGVLQENVVAVRFYQKHGFRIVGEFQESQGKDSYDMLLDLYD